MFKRKVDDLSGGSVSLTVALGETFNEDVEVLAARTALLDARMAALEARFADADEAAIVVPDQGDVLDVQVRAAKMAAELHLVTLELKSELRRLTERLGPDDEELEHAELLASSLIDLSDPDAYNP